MDEEIYIGAISKNTREDIYVNLSTFKGHRLCALRVYSPFGPDGKMKPTSKGITFNILILDDLIELLEAAKEKAIDEGFLSFDQ